MARKRRQSKSSRRGKAKRKADRQRRVHGHLAAAGVSSTRVEFENPADAPASGEAKFTMPVECGGTEKTFKVRGEVRGFGLLIPRTGRTATGGAADNSKNSA